MREYELEEVREYIASLSEEKRRMLRDLAEEVCRNSPEFRDDFAEVPETLIDELVERLMKKNLEDIRARLYEEITEEEARRIAEEEIEKLVEEHGPEAVLEEWFEAGSVARISCFDKVRAGVLSASRSSYILLRGYINN